ncbi:sensor histidine kinase [Streptomyces sp. NPDC002795]|uniref:ATP-binding protein n=1 Tax=Streptomyces sp. NPDC002795 TaxID=3364665 RepID=UPI0036C16F6C
MIEIPELAAGTLAVGTVSAFVLGGGLLKARQRSARQRDEIDALRSRLDVSREELEAGRDELDDLAAAFTAEIAHLSGTRMPAAATHAAHPQFQVPGPLQPELGGAELAAGLDAVIEGLRTAIAQERKRVDAAARAGMRGATREIQACLYRLQDVLRGLQERYDDPELAQTLFALDHENEQSLRRAQVAAVVCGAWVGLARGESHLVEAVTGGQSRLAGYDRVDVHNHLEDGTGLISHAVEPVAIIVAELLDNALRYSSPDTSVGVHLERVHHGVSVTVDDAGVGMSSDERAHAQRMVAGEEPILLSELGDPPRMGLAAIGQLTRQFDLSVDLSSPSPYGGVRAVLLVRDHLLCRISPEERRPAAAAPRSTRDTTRDTTPDSTHALAADEAPVATPTRPEATLTDGDELPRRRRRARGRTDTQPHAQPHAQSHAQSHARPDPQPDAQSDPRPAPPKPRPATHRSPEEQAAALGALQAATAAARSAAPRDDEAAQQPHDTAGDRPGTSEGNTPDE